MTIRLCYDNWLSIIEIIAEKDWDCIIKTLPLVDKTCRAASLYYFQRRILPILEQVIGPLGKEFSSIQTYALCREKLEKQILLPSGGWQKLIHFRLDDALKNIQDEIYLEYLKNIEELLAARIDLNALSSLKISPLIQISQFLVESFSKRIAPIKRILIYQRVFQLTRNILHHGADPNQRGMNFTPLFILLMQQPFSPEDRRVLSEMIQLLVEYGADLDLAPPKEKTPRQLIKEIFPELPKLLSSS